MLSVDMLGNFLADSSASAVPMGAREIGNVCL
jgi:hypothetical protein